MMRGLLYTILSLCLLSCVDEQAERSKLIRAEVQKRLNTYQQERMDKCLEEIMEDVITDADSVVLRNSYFDIPDSLKAPGKRLRPAQPHTPFPDFEKPSPPVEMDTSDQKMK